MQKISEKRFTHVASSKHPKCLLIDHVCSKIFIQSFHLNQRKVSFREIEILKEYALEQIRDHNLLKTAMLPGNSPEHVFRYWKASYPSQIVSCTQGS